MGELANKVAWVTGGGTGIGAAGAEALAEDGAAVVLSGRREDVLYEGAGPDRRAGRRGFCQAGRCGRRRRDGRRGRGNLPRPRNDRPPGPLGRGEHPRPVLEPAQTGRLETDRRCQSQRLLQRGAGGAAHDARGRRRSADPDLLLGAAATIRSSPAPATTPPSTACAPWPPISIWKRAGTAFAAAPSCPAR